MDIRCIWLCRDVVLAEGSLPALMRVTRVAACAVIANPFSGRPTDDLAELVPFGAGLGELLVKEALALLTRPAIAACRSPFPPPDTAHFGQFGPADLVREFDDLEGQPPSSILSL